MRPLKHGGDRALSRPLNAVLGAPSHVALLRALVHTPVGLTGREAARAAGVAPRAALEGLARLERVGMVRHHPVGRAYLFDLNREHVLLKEGLLPLFEKERGMRGRLKDMLRRAFGKGIVSGCIYGSVARRAEHPGSDLDVCLIVVANRDKEAVGGRAAELFPKVADRLGWALSPVIFTRKEFLDGIRRRETYFLNVARDAEVFVGPDVFRIIHDEEDSTGTGR